MSEAAVRDGDVVRQYYIAVTSIKFKWKTFVDLLAGLGRDGLPIAVCCGPRDNLDAAYTAVAGSDRFVVSMLHSDLDDSERVTALENFRLAMAEWNYFNIERSSLDHKAEGQLRPGKSQVLVMTDVCLPSHALGETPLLARVMINFDIPSKKEALSRRMAACLGSPLFVPSTGSVVNSGGDNSGSIGRGKAAITVVVGDEVGLLSSLEESCGIIIDEMPINIFELV